MTVEAHGINITTTANNQNGTKGMKFTVGSTAITLNSATKQSGVSATSTCLLLNSSLSTIATGDAWSGDVSTFSGGVSLSANTTYYIVVNATNQTYKYNGEGGGLTYPYAGTFLNWIAAYTSTDGGDTTTYAWNIASINITGPTNATVTPSAQALTLTLNASVENIDTTTTPSSLNMNLNLVPASVISNVIGNTIKQGPSTIGQAFIRKDYPVVEGLQAAITKQTLPPNL